jgi:hypothetical protein
MSNPVDRFLEDVRTAGFADTDVSAEDAVSDSTPPNWRLQVRGAAALLNEIAAAGHHV